MVDSRIVVVNSMLDVSTHRKKLKCVKSLGVSDPVAYLQPTKRNRIITVFLLGFTWMISWLSKSSQCPV